MTRCEHCKNGKLPYRILLNRMTFNTIPPEFMTIPHCGHCGVWLSKTTRRKVDHIMTEVVQFKAAKAKR